MKKIIYSIIALAFSSLSTFAQTTAMDFNRSDCNGTPHHLFSELDSGNVVIMEFIMTCSSCIASGHAIEAMMTDLEMQYPGKVRLYQMAYTNSYTCATMTGFKNTNGFSSAVFDSGAVMVAYYGGFGMPTVAIVGGSNHDVLLTNVGFAPSDTLSAGTVIRDFFSNALSTNTLPASLKSFTTFPNPGNDFITIQLQLINNSEVKLEITDLSGQLVKEVMMDKLNSGTFEQKTEVSDLAPGIYLVKAIVDGKTAISRINISR